VYEFGGNTSLSITTPYGVLTIENTGYYTFTQSGVVIAGSPPPALVFTYTIQDDDGNSPETDTADLTININSAATSKLAPQPTVKMVELDLDESIGSIDTFSHTEDKTSFNNGLHDLQQDAFLDLSDVLTQTHSDSLDKYLGLADEDNKVSLNIDLELDKGAPIEQNVVLDKADSESEVGASAYVTNELFADGAMIISDAYAAPLAPLAEFETSELL
jgi:hypothetical protein